MADLWPDELDPEVLLTGPDASRKWCDRYPVTGARERLRNTRFSRRRHPLFDDREFAGDRLAIQIADCVRWFETMQPCPRVVVILADTDNRSIAAAEKVLAWHRRGIRRIDGLVIGTPHQEVEAWVIRGLTTSETETRLEAERLRPEVGFNPAVHPERLTTSPNTSRKDAKRVLLRLLGPSTPPPYPSTSLDPSRHAEVLGRAFGDLEALRSGTDPTLLASFILELEEVIARIVVPGPPSA